MRNTDQVARNGEASIDNRRFQLGQATPLSTPERVVLLSIVGVAAAADLISLFAAQDPDPIRSALSIVSTLTFALYIRSPLVATSALAVVAIFSLFFGSGVGSMLSGAVAAGPVLRLASTPLIFSYVGGLLVFTAVFASGVGADGATEPTNIAIVLVVAAFAGGVGLALRGATSRERKLERELLVSAEREREAILAERRWIAGELHDSIAHYLTIIALHVQILDDQEMRAESQEAIRVAARKALSDLRFVIELARDGEQGEAVPSGDLVEAIDEAQAELETAGQRVECEGNPADERVPRGVEIILARVVRESATNILKHAALGVVRFTLDIEADSISLQIASPLPDVPRKDLPSTGTGLNRMAERVLDVRGEFGAEAVGEQWVVSVCLPTV